MTRIRPHERLPCGWEGCAATLAHIRSLYEHWRNFYGQGLPLLNTGFTCDLPNCRCHGVHFPSLDRLARHKTYERSLKNKEFKQCTGALCGCGKLFANLTSHLNAVRKKNQQEDLQRKQKVPGSYMSDEEQEEDDDTHHMDEDVEDSGYISMSNSRQLSTRIRIKKENEGHVDDAPTFRQTRSTKRKQPAVETNAHKKDPDQHARLASIKRETIEADMDEDSNSTSDEDIIAAPRKRRLVKRSDIENVQTFHTEKNPPADPSKITKRELFQAYKIQQEQLSVQQQQLSEHQKQFGVQQQQLQKLMEAEQNEIAG